MKETTDIWFSAFLRSKGLKLHDYRVIGRGKVKCVFDISDEEWTQYKIEFNNSELAQFKTFIEQIKDLAF
jgi:uncharacterized protein YicC (UPF0701 family)